MKSQSRKMVSESNTDDEKKASLRSRRKSELIDWSLDIELIEAF
jgi:hypothetical protein